MMMTAATTTDEIITDSAALPKTPYRGIEAFRYVDQQIFFAREDETRKLLRYVAVYRGVLFYGDSGSGKSSLINAGFIPAIIAEGFTPDRLRVQPQPGKEITVERISVSPDGAAPFLRSNFHEDEETATRTIMSAAELKTRLQALPSDRRPLLIFDQFEEFATLFESVPRGEAVAQAQEAQAAILRVLLELLRDPTLPVKLLFVFREDYLAKLNKLVSLFPDLSDQYLRLTPPGAEALHKIIRGSFDKFPGHFGKEISADLTRTLAQAIQERNEGGKLNLSEVQIACLELWKSGRPEELFSEKGVQGLLEDYLSDSITRLPEDLRSPAVALLSRMVTPSGTRNIVSEYDLISQVHEDEDISEQHLKAALQALVNDTRLVRRERRYDTYFYDIVSEFLVPWISHQKAERLAEIERREFAKTERIKRRKAYTWALVGLAVAVVIAIAAWLQVRSWNEAAAVQAARSADVREARQAEQAARAAEQEAEEARKSSEGQLQAAREEVAKAKAYLKAQNEAKDKEIRDKVQPLNDQLATKQKLIEKLDTQANILNARLKDCEKKSGKF